MTIYRSRLFSPIGDPFGAADPAHTFIDYDDGFLEVSDGKIAGIGAYSDLDPEMRAQAVTFGPQTLITPGFVDTHLHAPQLEMIGSYGGRLLEWLNQYTFPTEARFADPGHARRVAPALFRQLLGNGTLCALAFSTIHARATDIFFESAEAAGFRAVIGKTLMDRNAPPELLQNPKVACEESKALIERWHGRGLLRYAVSPRFAPTCSEQLLELAGELYHEYEGVYLQTHVSENVAEVDWVRELFPSADSYVGVYDRYGLLGTRSILAHGVHLTDRELNLMRERGARVSHCPNSNLFLGSGLFALETVLSHRVPVSLGTDIGAGTTPSMFNAMADAYKVQQVRGISVTPFELWYLATLAGARALSLHKETGSLEVGKTADFIVLDPTGNSLLGMRSQSAESIQELLAGFIFLGDERVVRKAFIQGRDVTPERPSSSP